MDKMLAKLHHRLSKRQSPILQTRKSQVYPPATEASPKQNRVVEPFSQYRIPIQYPAATLPLPPRASLLGIPAEIRLHIYSYLLSSPRSSQSNSQEAETAYTCQRLAAIQADQGLTPGTQLLTINRQIYHESLPFIRRSVLLVPRERTITWLDHHGTLKSRITSKTLPVSDSRLSRVDASTFENLQVKELVIREYLQDLPSTSIACTQELQHTVHQIPLIVDTVYLQLCTCRLPYELIPSSPYFARNYAGQVAGGIFWVFLSILQVRRVVVYYCGIPRGGIRHNGSNERGNVLVEAMRNVFNEIVMERRVDGTDIWWTDTIKSELENVRRYVMTFPEFEGRKEGQVEVEFWDTFEVTGKTCVLE